MLTLMVSIVVIGLLVADVFFVEYENFGWTTISILLTGGLLHLTKLWGVSDWVISHSKLCVVFILTYIVAGIVWSFFKWFSYLLSYRNKFLDIKNNLVEASNKLINSQLNWATEYGILCGDQPLNKDDLPLQMYNDRSLFDAYCLVVKDGSKLHNDYVTYNEQYNRFYKPIASKYKTKIVAWICYWPFSLVGTFIQDPVRRFVNFIFNYLKSTYQRISDSVFKDFPDKNYIK